MPIQNSKILQYKFLNEMYGDAYYPAHLVDEIKNILVDVCQEIETHQPKNLAELYILTHAATEKINDLQTAFDEAESEIETVAREAIGEDFYFIAKAYEYYDADREELISPRDW
ncbi:DUF5713 family protein [Acinetobacter sichuanensis]|uniref:DUF5713 family protein n=1 Tax=Acinetobacter sichuanensis TaxID=2136183 RepID=A0A371YN60_9GAMM|nr:DUF5713 family protein [Acinetobacter sichuanensis]RFC82911.1 hypothetical protein C9E89_014420 [Acinetobacter sichuanensis]